MKWISSTRKFKNAIEKLYFKIHGHAVSVKELQDIGAVQAVSSRSCSVSETLPRRLERQPLTSFREIERGRAVNPARKALLYGKWDASQITVGKLDARALRDMPAIRKMKHGHQAKWYRQSVKANVKPEEAEDT